nr:MAG TPA: hypothetical protein [Caudoviricetes sp.]
MLANCNIKRLILFNHRYLKVFKRKTSIFSQNELEGKVIFWRFSRALFLFYKVVYLFL